MSRKPSSQSLYLYLLQDADGPFIKMGIAGDVFSRIRALPDCINLAESICTLFESEIAAYRTEQYLLRILKKYSAPKSHNRDGFSEWLHQEAKGKILEALRYTQSLGACGPLMSIPHKIDTEEYQVTSPTKEERTLQRKARYDAKCL